MVYQLYVFVIRPSTIFASLILSPGCETVSAKKRLSRMQRLVCLGLRGDEHYSWGGSHLHYST
jgi:hypothetical protein